LETKPRSIYLSGIGDRRCGNTAGRFDFEGLTMPRLDNFLGWLGGRPMPYIQIKRIPSLRIALGEMWADCRQRVIRGIRRRD